MLGLNCKSKNEAVSFWALSVLLGEVVSHAVEAVGLRSELDARIDGYKARSKIPRTHGLETLFLSRYLPLSPSFYNHTTAIRDRAFCWSLPV